jgi:hypothetical protein
MTIKQREPRRPHEFRINRLEDENETLREVINTTDYALRQLMSYLQSPKFNDDTTVQVADVLRRIENDVRPFAADTLAK